MPGQHTIVRDSYHRWRVELTDSLAIGVKLLAEDHPRRVENNVHAYVVADLRTELGPWRIRDIRIMWSAQSERHFVRYRQWKTGQFRADRGGEQKAEWLDVAGPQDAATRAKVQEAILSVFHQIKEEAAAGTLGKRRDDTVGTLGDNPEIAAQLVSLKGDLEEAEAGDFEAAQAEPTDHRKHDPYPL